jgi:hypothetical protein
MNKRKKEQYKYLITLWQGLTEMVQQGKTLEVAKERYTIEKDFPYFKNKIIERQGRSLHVDNIESILEKLTKK